MSSSKFEEFLNKVTSKVKSKEAHGMIKKELTHHLQELSHSFQKRNSSQEEADAKAINEMGNPFTIGESLNRIHKPKIDWVLIFLFVMMISISFLPLRGGPSELSSYFIGRQTIWLTLSVLVIVGVLFFDYRKLKNWWIFFYGSGLILHLYIHLFGYMTNGVKKWMSIGGVTIDVTAITLLLFFLAWAGIFSKINEFHSWIKQVLLFFLFWTPILLYILVPQVMLSIMYIFFMIAMFAFSHIHKKLALKLAATNVVAGIIFMATMLITSHGGYYYNRLFAFINPEADPNGAGYMYIVVRDALLQAGWLGNGLYNLHSIPEPHTDFVFPYLVYSLGWAFGILLCTMLLIFILRISKNAFKTKDLYGRLLVIGGATLFTVPAFWNILMGFELVPIMAVPLPFISYGGSMLLFNSVILGLILNVYRRKDITEPTIVKQL
ncbi:FtsW/RodA/SpoVE family cell cycle protein [Caldalkalibacillus mannanilyticus]|uniref:FtsW/RodA/SpoVE family cell cycle protein n=1 Tax=Caldalkalibacillus mannanilyticus TaxID=1418 RepID=UPI00046AA6A0|nr:FtsW/RodA/SpoVE family cell cycle protein [Caldalkalibacillus mannanilyticus]